MGAPDPQYSGGFSIIFGYLINLELVLRYYDADNHSYFSIFSIFNLIDLINSNWNLFKVAMLDPSAREGVEVTYWLEPLVWVTTVYSPGYSEGPPSYIPYILVLI